jgi:hypothetical protein
MKTPICMLLLVVCNNLYGAAQESRESSAPIPASIIAMCALARAKGADPAAVDACLRRYAQPTPTEPSDIVPAQPALADSPELNLLCATSAGNEEKVIQLLNENKITNIDAGISGVKVPLRTLCDLKLAGYLSMTSLMIAITLAQKQADPCNTSYYRIANELLKAGADAFGVRTRGTNNTGKTAYDIATVPCLRTLIDTYKPTP